MISRFFRSLLPPVLAGVMFSSLTGAVATAADPVQTLRTATDELLAILYDKPADARRMSERMRPVRSICPRTTITSPTR